MANHRNGLLVISRPRCSNTAGVLSISGSGSSGILFPGYRFQRLGNSLSRRVGRAVVQRHQLRLHVVQSIHVQSLHCSFYSGSWWYPPCGLFEQCSYQGDNQHAGDLIKKVDPVLDQGPPRWCEGIHPSKILRRLLRSQSPVRCITG